MSKICDNMDGPWRIYSKWKKSDREWQILYDITYIFNVGIMHVKFISRQFTSQPFLIAYVFTH